jgi:hypothetical protein
VIEAPQRRPARWGERLDGWGFTSGIRRRLLGLLVALAIVMAGMLVHPAYVIFRPGPVYDTLGSIDGKPVIEVKGTETYDASGDLYFTTVGGLRRPGARDHPRGTTCGPRSSPARTSGRWRRCIPAA